jgi:hypothetical protein
MKKIKNLAFNFKVLILFSLCFVIIFQTNYRVNAAEGSFDNLLNNYEVYPEPAIQKPAYLQPYTDPVFGTKITRITNNDGVVTGSKRIHLYALQQPWNADDSYLLLMSGFTWHLYNGQTYEYIKTLKGMPLDPDTPSGTKADPIWDPTNPDIFYFFDKNTIKKYTVSSDTITTLRTFPNYIYVTPFDKGLTISPDGKIAFVGLQGGDDYSNATTMWVYNVFTDKLGPPYTLAVGASWPGAKWAGISHSGNYVVVGYLGSSTEEGDGYCSYSVDPATYALTYLGNINNAIQHGDVTIDEDGSDVFVVIDNTGGAGYSKHLMSNPSVKTRVLGKPITEIPFGNETHISGRCINKKGWVIISNYADVAEVVDGVDQVFEDEIFAVKINGSGEVRRIAHHHSQVYSNGSTLSYWATPRATANRYCNKILFESNWRDTSNNGDNVDVYIVDLSRPSPPQNLRIVSN